MVPWKISSIISKRRQQSAVLHAGEKIRKFMDYAKINVSNKIKVTDIGRVILTEVETWPYRIRK